MSRTSNNSGTSSRTTKPRRSVRFAWLRGIYDGVNWIPDRCALRWFGWVMLIALAIVSVIVWRSAGSFALGSRMLLVVGVLFGVLGTVCSGVLLWPYRVWMALTVPVGFVVQRLMLCLFYYVAFTPLGVLFRLFGRDPLCRRFEPAVRSYWVDHKAVKDPGRYFRQY